MEFPDGVDLVAEVLDTHWMRQRGWEHVDDAATDGEFATVHHEVDAGVRVLDQFAGGLVERQLLALGEHQRLDVAKPRDHRLDQGTYRHDQDADGAEQRTALFGMLQSAENRHAARHGIRARGEPFMGKGLPCFELRHIVRIAAIPGTDGFHGLLGFAT